MAKPFTGHRVSPSLPRLAEQTARFRFFSHDFSLAVSSAPTVYRRPPRVYVVQFNSHPPVLHASNECCRAARPPCPDRFSRKRGCRSRFIFDKRVKCVRCAPSDFLPRCIGWHQARAPLVDRWGRIGANSSAGDSAWQRCEDASVSHRTFHRHDIQTIHDFGHTLFLTKVTYYTPHDEPRALMVRSSRLDALCLFVQTQLYS